MPFSDTVRDTIRGRLAFVYGSACAAELLQRVVAIANAHLQQRERVSCRPLWSEQDALLITYGDSLQRAGELPLHTLKEFARQHLRGAISTIHLLPFFPFSSDDGFSVIDYRVVDPNVGDWDAIHALSCDFKLMFDFVLNHVSRESLWFADFMEHMPPGNHFFISGDATDPRLQQVVRPRTSPLLVEIRTRHEVRHVWATFSKDQIDLNYANPDVLMQALDILLFYVRNGASILRLDAIAFLWKELGTSCVHLPQTHAIVKLMRDVLQAIEPGVILLTETNVPHAENVSYFGSGDEAHMVYQFGLPPLLLHALHSGSTHYLRPWLQKLEPAPAGCSYLNFTASHDGVGLRPLEGLLEDDEVESLLDDMRERGGFISTRTRPDGVVAPYELNISYFAALRDPRSDYDKWQEPRFLLSQTLALSLRGVPAIYIHSLLATPNDHLGVERTGRTRSINRRKWDVVELERLLNDSSSAAHRVFNQYIKRLKLRRSLAAFHPDAAQKVFALGDQFLGLQRTALDGKKKITCVYNFTPFAKTVQPSDIELTPDEVAQVTDLISGEKPRQEAGEAQLELILPGYAAYWLA